MYIDAHTHLNDDKLFPDRQDHIDDFADLGGVYLVVIGTDTESSHKAIQIAEQNTNTQVTSKATIGIHPGEVSFESVCSSADVDQVIDTLTAIYQQHTDQIVAIGECGIDAHYPNYAQHKKLQTELFVKQCQLATDLHLPVVVHSRDQFPDTLRVLKQFPDLRIYLHCRGYGAKQIEEAVASLPDLRIGWCGNVTFHNATNLQTSLTRFVELTDGDHLLLETDAPYLTPVPERGRTNAPKKVIHIYQYVADLLGRTDNQLQEVVQSAATALYE